MLPRVLRPDSSQIPGSSHGPFVVSACIYMVIISSKSKDQPSKIFNPARGQLNRKNISLSRFATENSVSQDGFGNPVRRQPAHHHTQAESGTHLRDSPRVPRWRPIIFLSRHTPSDQSRVYRVTQLRTDGVHCRKSAGTGLIKLKVVSNGCCLDRSLWTNYCAPVFLTHPIGMKWT